MCGEVDVVLDHQDATPRVLAGAVVRAGRSRRLGLERRQRQLDSNSLPRPRPALDAATVPPCSSVSCLTSGEPETEAAAGTVEPALALREGLEQERQVLLVDAVAVVAHRDGGEPGPRADRELDVSARRRVARRVGEQVGDHLHQPVDVAEQEHRMLRHVDSQLLPARLDRLAHALQRVRGDVAQVEPASCAARSCRG